MDDIKNTRIPKDVVNVVNQSTVGDDILYVLGSRF